MNGNTHSNWDNHEITEVVKNYWTRSFIDISLCMVFPIVVLTYKKQQHRFVVQTRVNLFKAPAFAVADHKFVCQWSVPLIQWMHLHESDRESGYQLLQHLRAMELRGHSKRETKPIWRGSVRSQTLRSVDKQSHTFSWAINNE